MGCFKLNTKANTEEVIYMRKYNKDKKKATKKEKNRTKDGKVSKQVIQISLGGVITVIVTIAGAVVGATWLVANNLGELRSDIVALDKDIDTINTEISEMSSEISVMSDYLYNDGGVQDQLGDINKLLGMNPINASLDITSSIGKVSMQPNDIGYVTSSITSETCIGTDSDGNVYIAEDLINETILLTYFEDDKEVYFLGQYNENYKWNGYCVTNAYNLDGTLYGICESNFDNGKRLDYKSFCYLNKTEWIYSDKICNEDENSGINILYSFNYEKIKNFTNTNARITDILYVDKFIETSEANMLKYYSGNTFDGKYNDDSGNAYEVVYNDDGTVKMLYVGEFVNGTFCDDDAWSIVYSENYEFYVHNTGKFENGKAVNKSTEPISIDEINEIISSYNFDCELKWK